MVVLVNITNMANATAVGMFQKTKDYFLDLLEKELVYGQYLLYILFIGCNTKFILSLCLF